MDNKNQRLFRVELLLQVELLDIGCGYYRLMDNFMVSLGYAITNKTIKVEREDGNSDEYTIEFDSNSSHAMIGFDYVMP